MRGLISYLIGFMGLWVVNYFIVLGLEVGGGKSGTCTVLDCRFMLMVGGCE